MNTTLLAHLAPFTHLHSSDAAGMVLLTLVLAMIAVTAIKKGQ